MVEEDIMEEERRRKLEREIDVKKESLFLNSVG